MLPLTPVFLGRVDPKSLSFWLRLPLSILGVLGPIALFFLWFGMWRYWVRIDSSKVYAKRLWFVVLLVGFWYGSCLYYFFVYRPQAIQKRGREGGVLGTSEDVKSRFGRLLVAGWVVVLGGGLLLILFPKTVWIPGPEVMRVSIIVLVLTSVVYGLTVIYRQGTDRAKRK